MNPVLFSLYGPLAIHAYGLCVAIGVMLALALLLHDKKMNKIISNEDLITTIQLMIIVGYFGGRMGFLLSEAESWSDYIMLFEFWKPGLSILGSIIGIILIMSSYLWYKKIPILSFFDRMAIYAPLAQSFGRIGCFFAGCCYGMQTNSWLSITYTHPEHMAPLHIALYPTQLYSSICLCMIFLLLYFVLQKKIVQPGILLCSYLALAGLERFLIDFARWDRLYFSNNNYHFFSIHQWISLVVIISASLAIVVLHQQRKKAHGSV